MEAKVYRQDGTEAGRSVSLDPSVFGIIPNDHAIWLDVKAIQANARQGTHKAKDRGEVAGSTRKLYRQKGTGGARAGSAKSPIRRTGGTIFGPRPRSYNNSLNKKTKRLARRSAFSHKVLSDNIRVLEGIELSAPSTRQVASLLKTIGLGNTKVLLLTDVAQEVVFKSGRNIPRLTVRDAASASTLDVMSAQVVVLLESALPVLSAVLGDGETEESTAVDAQ